MNLLERASRDAPSQRLWLGVAAVGGLAAGLVVTTAAAPGLPVAILIGLLGVVAILIRPELGLYLLILTVYLMGLETELLALLILAILLRWASSGGSPSGWWLPALLIAPYALVATSTLLVARDASVALSHLVWLGRGALLAFVVFTLLDRRATLRRLTWTLLLTAVIMGSVSVHQQLTGSWDFEYWGLARTPGIYGQEYRAAGPLGDPNYYALVLLVMVPLAVDRIAFEKRLPLKLLALWALLVSLLAIVFTFSRGAIVGLVAMILLALALSRHRWKLVLGGMLATAILLPLIPVSYMERLESLPASVLDLGRQGPVQDRAVQNRLSENLVAVEMFLDHPVLGVGYANYPVRYQEYAHSFGLDTREGRTPHSLYLQVAAESGVLGLIAFGVVLWSMIRSVFLSRREARGRGLSDCAGLIEALGIGLAGFLTASLFLHAAYQHFFWLLAGIAWALPRVVRGGVDGDQPGLDIPSQAPVRSAPAG